MKEDLEKEKKKKKLMDRVAGEMTSENVGTGVARKMNNQKVQNTLTNQQEISPKEAGTVGLKEKAVDLLKKLKNKK